MQDPEKVKFADVSPDTREKVKIFLSTLKLKKCTLEGKKVKTLEDAINFAIIQAERVPSLEKENITLREELEKCKKRIEELEMIIQEDREMRG